MAPTALSPSPAPLKHTASAPVWRPTEILDAPKRDIFSFDPIEDALAAFSAGEFLVVMDDEGRENEGDLITAASLCTTEKMAWMIKHTRCVQIIACDATPERVL